MTRILSFEPRIQALRPLTQPEAPAAPPGPRVGLDATSPVRADAPGLTRPFARIMAGEISRSAPVPDRPSEASIHLQAFAPLYAAYGSRTVAVGAQGVERARESVALVAGGEYLVSTAFGLSDARGQMRVEIRDAGDQLIRSIVSAPGIGRARLAILPGDSGLYSVNLAGEQLPGEAERVRIYGSYQVVIAQQNDLYL